MRLSSEQVDYVAALARLGLSPRERETMREQLSSIIAYVETLNELDTSQVPPSAQVIVVENVTRPDVVEPSLEPAVALANAPEQADGFFVVPPVFEEG
jgi:aspartyl-tRNA(Asn)/glutamyl-tRNA(Gln) amidotransferase subunit C